MTNRNQNSHSVKSLVKALRLLQLFAKNRGGLSVNEMVTALGYHRSSIQRILSTLEAEGFLERTDPPKSVYRLGPEMFLLERTAVRGMNLERIGRPYLEHLVNLTQETAHLYVVENFKACCIASVETTRSVRLTTSAGQNVPLHCTGVGKALLSGMNDTEVNEVISNQGLPRFTDNTICERDRLMDELNRIRREGIVYDNEEFEIGVRCLAAPIYNGDDQVVTAISVAGPIYRVTPEVAPRFAVIVKDAAWKFSQKLGFRRNERPGRSRCQNLPERPLS